MATILVFIISLITSFFGVSVAKRIATRYNIGALPSVRKIHTEFKPLLGGLGIFIGLIMGILIANFLQLIPLSSWENYFPFWAGLLLMLLTGLLDDVWGVDAIKKFSGQFLAALLATQCGCLIEAFYSPGGTTLELGWFSYPFTILWIMFVINAVNLLDGLDGLAGGISLIITVGFLIVSIIAGNAFLTVLAFAFLGALLGFLKHNYHPASIFMGDVGSLALGFILAFFSIEALKIAGSHQVYFLAALVLMGMPVTDTLISFFRRMGRGEHPFRADKEHIHHRLINLGLSHLQTVWLMYLFAILYVILGVFMVMYREMVGTPLFLVAFVFSIFWAWRLGYLETRRLISFGAFEQPTFASLRPLLNLNRIWHQLAILIADISAISLALFLTFWLRFKSGFLNPPTMKTMGDYLNDPVLLIFAGVWLLLFWLNGLYRMPWDVSRFDKSLKVSKVITFGALFLLVLLNLDILVDPEQKPLFNKAQIYTLAFYWLAMIVCVNGLRLLVIEIEKHFHIFEYTYKNTLLIGATRKAKNIIRDIQNNPHLLNNIIGVVERKPTRQRFEGFPILGDYQDLPRLIQEHKIEEIIVALNENVKEDLLNIIGVCDRLRVVVKTLPALQSIVSGRARELAGHALVRVFPENMVLWQWFIKRLIDLIFSLLVFLILLPLWLPVMILMKLRLLKNVIVKVPILGKKGRIFNMYLLWLEQTNQSSDKFYQEGPNRAELTSLGKFLYRTQLYRLPQVFNILRGDMSLVGPRPEPPEWYRTHQNQLRFLHRRLMVRPGITGFAQIKYRFDESQKMLKERMKYDIYYVENISLNLDFRILIRSILLLFKNPKKKWVEEKIS